MRWKIEGIWTLVYRVGIQSATHNTIEVFDIDTINFALQKIAKNMSAPEKSEIIGLNLSSVNLGL